MKKIIIGLIISLSCITDVFANEVIHGIDIDYASWPARQLYYDLSKGQKEKIKKILDKIHNPEI